ncbi:flagellin [Sulfitobacter dubius]|uniref:flagellin N-terminal helical domain-containing protein n=1 Tax=Sulfitobacter dubius TaxID=218673 RepID=UPI0008EA2C75|nr:flagellin [Sulfitobacter dubius]SFH17717.1 flagellin [Sulfitobacter dubius]
MSSINTNTSAMNALATLRNVNSSLNQTQDRISTGLKVSSGKDNAAYFAISETMKGDSGMTKAINESLTLTKNSLATARVGADSVKDLAQEFVERVGFAQTGGNDVIDQVKTELDEIVKRMDSSIKQAIFNGDDLVSGGEATAVGAVTAADGTITKAAAPARSLTVVTGVTRVDNGFEPTTMSVEGVSLKAIHDSFKAIADNLATNYKDDAVLDDETKRQTYLSNTLKAAEDLLSDSVTAATTLGVGEKSIESQQEFLTKLADNLDSGVGAMVDANMEEEAARLQALQVQQQLASQSLSIANQAPQNILSLFR